jgi:hypothetical protein
MKKKNITFGMIVLLTVSGLFPTACSKQPEQEKIISGTVTADAAGIVLFMYSRTNKNNPEQCAFTTDLPAPNDRFTVTILSGESTGKKEIEGLTAGQKVSWTATVDGKALNHGSNNFVHIIND